MLNTVIIDDEPNARDTIREMLKLYCPDINVVAEAGSVKDGYEIIIHHNPQLVLLDIQLTDGTGFDLLKKFTEYRFKFIFITAYKEHAIRAFKYSALDYLLKPIDPDDLIETISRAHEKINSEEAKLSLSTLLENINSKSKKQSKIVLRTSESIHLIDIKDIVRCESSSNYTKFYISDGRKLLVSKTLKEYNDMLNDKVFFRTHQSHLVNINFIDRYEKTEGGYLIMKDGSTVPVSFRKKDQLIKLFEQF